jgi:hypothetical protein
MILNGYSILDAFVISFRLGLGLLILLIGLSVWRTWNSQHSLSEKHQAIDARLHLLFQMAVVLFVLNLASWPILYLVLQSYVPEWPEVMCIYGVTQIGAGSAGPARYLPMLLQSLQATKPVLVFLSGAWLVLHLLNRRTQTAPLTGWILVLVMAAALMALSDGALEMAYLMIPKREEFPSAGCCTVASSDSEEAGRFVPRGLVEDSQVSWVYAAYFGINGLMVLGLIRVVFLDGDLIHRKQLGALLTAAFASAFVNWLFLVGVAAPLLLHMPNHQCPYDLVSAAPGSLVSVALFVAGFFGVGWAGVARWFGLCEETTSILNEAIRRLLLLGVIGYVGSLLIMIIELALA